MRTRTGAATLCGYPVSWTVCRAVMECSACAGLWLRVVGVVPCWHRSDVAIAWWARLDVAPATHDVAAVARGWQGTVVRRSSV